MNSDSFKKSVAEIFEDLDPELLKKLLQNETISEIPLAGRMLWRLIATGKHNEELCSWAAQIMAQVALSLPEKDSPIQQEIRKRLAEGGSAENVAAEFEENSTNVWRTYTKALVLAVAQSIQSGEKKK